MSSIQFKPWPKTPRLNRDIVITEKIDGTNAAVQIIPLEEMDKIHHVDGGIYFFEEDDEKVTAVALGHVLVAQSRNRIITPGKDNFAFAEWVKENADALVSLLGPGTHYGEWWGHGIGRGYGKKKGERYFSLFNVNRYAHLEYVEGIPSLRLVPVLYTGPNNQNAVTSWVEALRTSGSVAAPGYEKPEGVIVFHSASQQVYKVTLEKDEAPKSALKDAA